MFTRLMNFLKRKKTEKSSHEFNPKDFSNFSNLQITIKKDGTKEYRPFGYTTKKGTPQTTIIYEDDQN